MSKNRFWFTVISLLVVCLLIHWYANNPNWVELQYSLSLYPIFSRFFSILFGWIPFSVGDILYGLAGIWILVKLVTGCKVLLQRKLSKELIIRKIKKVLILILSIYILFNLLWGINYNRQGIAQTLKLNVEDTISYIDIKTINHLLADKLNASKNYLLKHQVPYPSNKNLFKEMAAAYRTAKDSLPFLQYTTASVKPSMWGWLGNYTGFTGYYNPFTGEAQVNTYAPKFLQPFVTCHEIAHQVGYAKENEANAVGYLVALHSNDSLLLYSTYFDLYIYAFRELAIQSSIRKDTTVLFEMRQGLIPAVKEDFKTLNNYFHQHQNPIEPFIRKGYGMYLRNNNQPGGMKSYDEVLRFIISYYKKFGKI